ncbi:iron complex transport system substrate-binding protein [Halodesulfovibrio marinisediminis DSM 17456]|uniref:Iron complex transport system substrate-binding protein n=2 Tax=Halodesulfovibrio marinisediminis TaxID=458711 RepID=A0A1N6H2E0_9BACT|nr:iron complex transport system substrate-binding protein [Halodesulfovibrio marinisediminis DSM 17456]
MRLKHFLLPVLLLLFASTALASNSTSETLPTPVSITDDLGRTIELQRPATRIIALYGAFNEMLAELGKEDTIIARTKADALPVSILSKPSIGTHMRPNPELVAGLRPDIVLQMGGRKKALESVRMLEELGIPVAFFSITTFDELFSVIKRLGTLTGAEEQAELVCNNLQARLDHVQQLLKNTEHKPSVFFEVRYPNLLGAGNASIVNDIINHAGGINIMDAAIKLVRINEEEVIKRDPEVYLIQQGAMNPNPQPIRKRAHFRTISAVKNNRVHVIDESSYSRPGPRAVSAVEELAALLHPNRMQPTSHISGDM